MKVVHISTSATGGAGIAAFRLHESMLSATEVNSNFLQKIYMEDMAAKNMESAPEKSSLWYRLTRKLKLTPEYRNEKRVPVYSLTHDYEIATFPTSSYRIENHPLVKDSDIVHIHWVANFLNYPTFFSRVKQPIVWTLHDMNPFQGIFHYKEDSVRNMNKYGRIDMGILEKKKNYIHQKNNLYIVSPSQWLADLSASSETLGRYRHSVIPYGIDDREYLRINKIEAKQDIGVDNGRPTIIFVAHGVDIYRKGFDVLMDAIKGQSNSTFNLISVGGDKIDVDKRINHLHYERINDRHKLNLLYTAADLTVLPSREDNLPNVMLESFANGTPVLSFSNGGMAEHVKTGMNGILLEETSSGALQSAIEDFLGNRYVFDDEVIRDYARKTFSPSLQVDRYIDLYKQILSR